MATLLSCPCGSNRQFAACCDRYITGAKNPPTAEGLMRSRFTAYKLGNADYILASWAPEKRQDINQTELVESLKTTQYQKLKIISKKSGTRKNHSGQVEFQVTFLSNGQLQTFRENSNFTKQNNQWYYVDGNIS